MLHARAWKVAPEMLRQFIQRDQGVWGQVKKKTENLGFHQEKNGFLWISPSKMEILSDLTKNIVILHLIETT